MEVERGYEPVSMSRATGIDVALPAFQTTSVEFTPGEAGEFPFRCGMNMLKGLLVVEPATTDRRPSASPHKLHG